jgi:hypothetical protein
MRQAGLAGIVILALAAAGPLASAQPKPGATPKPSAAAKPSATPAPTVETPLHPVIYEMDTLRTGALPPDLLKQMEPIHSLQAIEDLLKANLIAFAWAHGQIGAGALPSELTKQIDTLPPHEVFMVKQGDGWLMGVVVAKH